MEFFRHTLPNGIRIIHKQVNSPVAHCGLIINVGSRDEKEEEQGLAHFIEHSIFKGTSKRKAYHILSRMEDVGGEINAYTTKEETSIYAAFLSDYYSRAIELLFDITFNSTFPAKEIKKEKDVIIDEILSYQDSPSELIFDDFEEHIFKGHPIGKNILGTPEHVKSFTQKHIINFIKNNYNTNEMVFSSVGNISFDKLCKLVEKYTEQIPTSNRVHTRLPLNGYHPDQIIEARDTYQSHAIIGNRAYDSKNDKVTALILLNNILGGPGMNSRLNLGIREKYGFAYNIESFYTPYSDTGIVGIYIGTDKGTMDKSIKLVHKELNNLRTKKLGPHQLKKAKSQLIGQLAIAQENNSSLMLSAGKAVLTFDKVETIEEINARIESVTAEELLEVANEVFNPSKLTTLIFKAK